MEIVDYICLMLILMGVGTIYKRYMDKYDMDNETNEYKLIRKYLLNNSSITKEKKPIIWIHIPYEYNSRKWESFYSRGSMDLNQPYQNLTIRSIIDHNPDFHVCLIDDSSFKNLLPGWVIDISKAGEPVKSQLRQLGLFKLLHVYGGMIVPSSFLCMRDLSVFYDEAVRGDKPFVAENRNTAFTGNSNAVEFMPDVSFMGAPKDNDVIKDLCKFTEKIISTDSTDESTFLGEYSKWCLQKYQRKSMNIINGRLIGTKDTMNRYVDVEDLLSEKTIDLETTNKLVGIYIPSKELLSRQSLNWFCNLGMNDILTANNLLSKFFNLATINVNTDAKHKKFR